MKNYPYGNKIYNFFREKHKTLIGVLIVVKITSTIINNRKVYKKSLNLRNSPS